jgi:hypothetical protein
MNRSPDLWEFHPQKKGGSGKAEGLADGSIAFEKDHRQAALAAATRDHQTV